MSESSAPSLEFLAGGGELGALMRAYDWSTTSLGLPQHWPQSLKTAVRIMLTSRQPIWIGWGPELIYLYNDAYKSIIGGKHPWALGKPTKAVWSEIWNEIGPMLATAMTGDEGIYVEQQLLIMERNGYPEETYYTFSYSPIPNDDGAAGGIICANSDDTQRVISERQLGLLRDLAAGIADARTWQEVCERAAKSLGANTHDLPFAMIYMAEPESETIALAGLAGIDTLHLAVPGLVTTTAPSLWPFSEVLQKQDRRILSDIHTTFGSSFPSGAWSVAPTRAAVVPIPASGETDRAGVLIAGLNPFRMFDDGYRGFLTLVAGQIAASIASTQVYEEAKRRAEALAEIDRAKTTFFSNVSHEFRTPLTLMLTPLEDMLARSGTELSADSRGLLTIAHRNALRLLKLVNSLLDFSRIEAGRVQATFEALDLVAATAEIASSFRSAMERAGLQFTVNTAALPERVHVDREMWEKIVLNLLSNAFKFTFEGAVEVSLRASHDGRFAELTVRDTGTGIPADQLPQLFERFRRIEGARGRSYEGSGIGLALVQELVKIHGGSIHVESTAGSGSAFTVSLPLRAAHLPREKTDTGRTALPSSVRAQAYVDEALGWLESEQHAASEALSPSSADDLGKIASIEGAANSLVLLADDNADMRNYVRRLLESAGFKVEAVSDGKAALAAAKRTKPDLVLSDVMMPELDGFGLLAALRAEAGLREVPVVLLSARAGEEAKVEGLRSGADDYLIKPFAASELLARVEVHLKLSRMRQESAHALKEEADTLEKLNRVGTAIASEIDIEQAVQVVTDAATDLCGASFGAFFYNVINAAGESFLLYTLSGAPREAFSKFPQPRNTAIFSPTFKGEGVVRSDDITKDPRFGHSAPYHGMPKGHLPVCSYLAASVFSQSGEVIGGLFLGHPNPGVFTARAERLLVGIATQAGVAMDKARLYRAAQYEIERRKETETALRESEQMLERKVALRTAELSDANESLRKEAIEREKVEEALRQAQKMESIGQLTGGVAHDFNNLLTIIIGNLESLQRHLAAPDLDAGRRTEAIERTADQAMRGARRAASLTQRLLAFSRQQPLDPKPLDVNRLLTGMADMLRRSLGEQIGIQTVSAGGLWPVYVDPNQLEVAILNLAVNARDAMPKGGRLTIETANAHLDEAYATAQGEVIPGQYVVVAVTDNGEGMSPDTVARAFEPFFTTKEVGQGTGLGLSQVYGFVKQTGGHVKIYSERGQGTSVKIYLPRLHSTESVVEIEAVKKPPRSTAAETILVVEDDLDVRRHSTGLLIELGYTVLEAGDGRSGIRLIHQHPEIKMLFTDVGLPGGMNGRELADEVRRLRPELKVLFTTAYARNAIVHDGRLDAGVQLITKPYSYEALAAKMRDVLDAQGGPARILIVEDEILVQMLAVEFLEDEGFKAETAGSATEALNKLRLTAGGFTAAVVDMGLPDRKGEDLLQELRALYPSLPIIIASGQNRDSLRQRFGGDPRMAFLGKPYASDALFEALGSLGVSAK